MIDRDDVEDGAVFEKAVFVVEVEVEVEASLTCRLSSS